MQQFDKNPKISAENKKTLKELNQLSRKGVFLKVLTIDNLYNQQMNLDPLEKEEKVEQ